MLLRSLEGRSSETGWFPFLPTISEFMLYIVICATLTTPKFSGGSVVRPEKIESLKQHYEHLYDFPKTSLWGNSDTLLWWHKLKNGNFLLDVGTRTHAAIKQLLDILDREWQHLLTHNGWGWRHDYDPQICHDVPPIRLGRDAIEKPYKEGYPACHLASQGRIQKSPFTLIRDYQISEYLPDY